MVFTVVTDPARLNQALFRVTHGLYILTAVHRGRKNGQCLDALMQVTNAPPRVAIGVGKRSLTHEMIAETGRFAFSAIDREAPDCMEVIRHFGFQSGRDVDKFTGYEYSNTPNGLPLLVSAVAGYECMVMPEHTVDLGSHSLFIASVDWAQTRESGDPLTYNEYRNTLKQERKN